ncbi:MAG: two-component sensor histidine kinase, partial [Polyangiaceae bacterium]|nr:two-component sensor histidine kinase [Polyangiaceae bacterium]
MKLGVLAARAPSGLATRLAWITGLRLALLLALFGATTVFYLRDSLFRYEQSQRVIFWTFGIGFTLAAVYAALLRRGKNLEQLALGQILLDQVTWSAFVYVSGGPTSGATSFYALSALVGSVLIGQRGALTAAGMGLAAYTLLCVAFVLR